MASRQKIVSYSIGGLLLARTADRHRRTQWRLRQLCDAELRALRDRLHDLLPPAIAERRAAVLPGAGGAAAMCAACEAAVLQLDVCGFTAWSRVRYLGEFLGESVLLHQTRGILNPVAGITAFHLKMILRQASPFG